MKVLGHGLVVRSKKFDEWKISTQYQHDAQASESLNRKPLVQLQDLRFALALDYDLISADDNLPNCRHQPQMLISEIYLSRQGEGLLTGTPSVFVRTSGCNLRCDFCDTPFTSWKPTGNQQSIAEVVEAVVESAAGSLPDRVDGQDEFDGPATHVVLTGGEPMLAREVEQLCESLANRNFHITIETAGTLDRNLHCDLMSISPKLSNSTPSAERAGQWAAKHEATRHRPDIVAALIGRHGYQLKFVVAKMEDLDEIEAYLADVGEVDRSKVLLMPEGIDAGTLQHRAEWLEPLCVDRGFMFCPRQHIFWYGNKRAT